MTSDKLNNKQAYPNVQEYMNIPGEHDTQKWLQAAKEIYYGENNGENRSVMIRKVTSNWGVKEVYDFINWLRFYEEGTHLKYKTAQSWYYGNADVGYLLPVKQDPVETPKQHISGNDIDNARDSAADDMSASEKKTIIEKQRQKIIGRLDSAEKLLRSPEGQLFSDKEFASLLESIYDLKKKVQMVNKKSISTKLYDDIIIRQANVLSKQGFQKASDLLYSLAGEKAAPKTEEPPKDAIPEPTPPDMPMTGGGAPGGLPSMGPGSPMSESETQTKIQGFLDELDGNDTSDDVLEVIDNEDSLLVYDNVVKPLSDHIPPDDGYAPSDTDKQRAIDHVFSNHMHSTFISQAQEAPMPPPAAPPEIKEPKVDQKTAPIEPPKTPITKKDPADLKKDESLEVKEDETQQTTPSKDFDSIINSVFSSLTIADVVAKFEDIAKFYKTREMPRQLAFADMMLDSLGLAPFFPTLSEATNKALEANNYISSRIEDILSKLRGTMKTRELDLENEKGGNVSPEIQKAQQLLQQQETKDKEKKQMRKDLEDRALEEQVKQTPEVEVEEDLGGEKPKEPPAAPPAPPAKPV